ncbi:MAG: hypothetical protein HYV55_00540 [Parcubacteria group bacterium]|nr:hypothetical protein [Parcubacteria group bacterium]
MNFEVILRIRGLTEALRRFEYARRLLAHAAVLTDEQLGELDEYSEELVLPGRPHTRLRNRQGEPAPIPTPEEILWAYGDRVNKRVEEENTLPDLLPAPVSPVVDICALHGRGWRTPVRHTTCTGRTILEVGDYTYFHHEGWQFRIDRVDAEPFDPGSGRDVALCLLAGTELPGADLGAGAAALRDVGVPEEELEELLQRREPLHPDTAAEFLAARTAYEAVLAAAKADEEASSPARRRRP